MYATFMTYLYLELFLVHIIAYQFTFLSHLFIALVELVISKNCKQNVSKNWR